MVSAKKQPASGLSKGNIFVHYYKSYSGEDMLSGSLNILTKTYCHESIKVLILKSYF